MEPSMPKKSIPRRKDRRITVSCIYRDYYDDRFWTGSRKFPVLRFGGEWLAQAGFVMTQRFLHRSGR
jgi:hypothetical protein